MGVGRGKGCSAGKGPGDSRSWCVEARITFLGEQRMGVSQRGDVEASAHAPPPPSQALHSSWSSRSP